MKTVNTLPEDLHRIGETYDFKCLMTISSISRWFLGNLWINVWTSFIRCCRVSCSGNKKLFEELIKHVLKFNTHLPRLWTNGATEMSLTVRLGSLNSVSVRSLSSYFLTHPSFAHHWKTSIYPVQSFFCLVPCSITSLSLYSLRLCGTDPMKECLRRSSLEHC